MAFITRSTARQQIGRLLGSFYSGTTDSSGNTTTAAKDTDMGAHKNDWFNGKWIYFTVSGEERLIEDWVNSTFLFSWTGAIAAAPTSVAYQVLPYAATAIHSALDAAIDDAFPYYARTVRDFFVGGSPLINPFLQEWTSSTAARGWTTVGSPTIARITADSTASPVPPQPLFGIYALKMTNAGDSSAALWQHVGPGFDGKTIIAYALVHAVAGSRTSVAITDDDGTTNSTAHGGTGWELLTCTRTINLTGADSNKPTVEVQITTGTAVNVYVAAVWVDTGYSAHVHRLSDVISQVATVYRLGAMPTATDQIANGFLPRIPGTVRVPTAWAPLAMEADAADARYHAVRITRPSTGSVYEVQGFAPLTKPTADTDYIELEPEDAPGLYALAAYKVLSWLPAPQQTAGVLARMTQLKREYSEAFARRGSRLYSN